MFGMSDSQPLIDSENEQNPSQIDETAQASRPAPDADDAPQQAGAAEAALQSDDAAQDDGQADESATAAAAAVDANADAPGDDQADAENEAEAEVESEPAEKAPARELTAEELAALPAKVEAALLTTDRAMTAAKLGDALGEVGSQAINDAVDRLNKDYEDTGRSFRIEKVAGGWQVMTLPEYADVLSALHKTRSQTKLSAAALETLAIVAYKQPILRAEIEAIRGVASGEVLRSLMDRHLVKIAGRAEEIGRPILYGTTKQFLELFGLSNLKDLPKVEELKPKA